MEEQKKSQKQPVYRYEPGELEKTRKNIGTLDQAEAEKMTKILGGEIGYEKSVPVNEETLKKVRAAQRSREIRTSTDTTSPVQRQQQIEPKQQAAPSSAGNGIKEEQAKSARNGGTLPALTSKERSKMNKLMMSPDYRIKQNYGIFNFLTALTKNGQEKIAAQFITISLKNYVKHILNFHTGIQSLINLLPESYRNKIVTEEDLHFRFLKTVNNWPVAELEQLYGQLEQDAGTTTVTSMIPFIRQMYRILLSVFFLGEHRVIDILKTVVKDMSAYPDIPKNKVNYLITDLTDEWYYIYNKVTKGLYPLLLRVCSSSYIDYHLFLTQHTGKIFHFLGITKYDILLPAKKKAASDSDAQQEKQRAQQQKEAEQQQQIMQEKEQVQACLKILDRLFPGAGWLDISKLPDMYPFYQPLYNFPDGFNLLSPENPLQICIVLIKIIEDLFEGCRNISIAKTTSKNDTNPMYVPDSLLLIMNDWTAYRETVFDKLYVPYLKDFVNKRYTQKDFAYNQYGKRLITNMQWHTFYNYLPHMKFEQLLLEKPANESKMKPLSLRTSLLVKELRQITIAADTAQQASETLLEIPDIFDPYKFDIPNVVSKRLDILLGAKRRQTLSRATNVNLLKYTLAAATVLNWWIGSKDSPAYYNEKIPVCRAESDGSPIFSVPCRTDQNSLFIKSVKEAAAQAQAQSQPQEQAAI